MAVRQTMLSLINFVRMRIGDPDTGSPIFQTQDIQDALDNCRLDNFDEALEPMIERTASAILYKRHKSQFGFYETDYILLFANLQPATPDLAEVMREDAIFTFNSSPFPPVWMQYGKSYDVWRCCADLLEQMIALQAVNNVNFSANGQSFQLEQINASRYELIDMYRQKQRVEMVSAARTDAASAVDQQRAAKIGPVSSGVPFITGP